jgi:predicted transcriptional regulator of viral defense system
MKEMEGQQPNRKRRTISDALAPIIELFELKGDKLVVLDDLRNIRPEANDTTIRKIAFELVERGWLEPLAVQGAYEFIPGSAAGAFRSGDPWLELRAALKLNPDLRTHVGFSSAAWLRGYKSRAPDRQIIVGSRQPKPPPSLSKVYTVVKTHSKRLFGSEELRNLPVATTERIFVEVVWRPDLMDLRSDFRWISKLISDSDPSVVIKFLERLSIQSAWFRAGYLTDLLTHPELRDMIQSRKPSSTGPFYFGSSSRTEHYVSEWNLYDNLDLWKLDQAVLNDDY